MSEGQRAPWAADAETHRPIRGRRWRVSDPRIPEALRQALVDELMAARRAVGAAADPTAERDARDRVHDAKVALGERGLRWWLADPDPLDLHDRIHRTRRALASRVRDGDDPTSDDVAAVVSLPSDLVAQVLAGDGADRIATSVRGAPGPPAGRGAQG